MEESTLLSMLPHKIMCSTSKRSSAKQDWDPPVPLQPAFRLLCRLHTIGGVIGSSGSIIKRIEALTGVKIHIQKALPNCHERVINIVGDATVKKKISIIGSLKNGGNEDKEMVEVSKAQEGLIRVFERILEVQGDGENENDDINSNSKGLIGCRLLAATGQIGAVLGKGGKIVNGIQNNSGAKISVLKEQIPACAEPHEAVIQITGVVVSVKKALLAVSRCLQDCKLRERTSGQRSSCGVSRDSDSPTFSGNVVDYHPVGHSLSADVDRKLSLDETSNLKKVVFRFLCSNASSGGVIGKGANIVKSLEKETGTCIKLSPLVSGLRERVATISSVENPNPLYSPAQIAIIRVFTRSVQVALDYGLIPGMGKGENVTARILVERNQMGCLVDEGGRVASDISTSSGVEIQLLGAGLIPNFTVEDDKVVQIIGEYENVKSALFQVTGRLRENYFLGMEFNGSEHIDSSDSGSTCSSTNERVIDSSSQLEQLSRLSSSVNQLDYLRFVHKSSHPLPTGLRQKNNETRGNVTKPEDDAGNLNTFSSGLKNESLDEDYSLKKVVFRLLCSNASAGGVIGKGANMVKSLEKETGACIKFSPLVSGLRERVATISSVENPNPLYSPAQIAIIRVFTRSVEVSFDHGLIPGMGKGENVTARILVERNQMECLVDEGGSFASDISTAFGVQIQLLGAGLIPNCTVEDDKVVQIIGEYENVKSALFQVTGRLRENYFPKMGFNGSERIESSDSALACSSTNERVIDSSSQPEQLSRPSSINQLDYLRFVHKSSHHQSKGLRQKNNKTRGNVTRPEDDAGNLDTFSSGLKNKSKVADAIPHQTVEFLIPCDVFCFVYGDNGSNIIRLKEISGATVGLLNPCAGDDKGKVIISGSPEQIRIAESLLQAFISI